MPCRPVAGSKHLVPPRRPTSPPSQGAGCFWFKQGVLPPRRAQVVSLVGHSFSLLASLPLPLLLWRPPCHVHLVGPCTRTLHFMLANTLMHHLRPIDGSDPEYPASTATGFIIRHMWRVHATSSRGISDRRGGAMLGPQHAPLSLSSHTIPGTHLTSTTRAHGSTDGGWQATPPVACLLLFNVSTGLTVNGLLLPVVDKGCGITSIRKGAGLWPVSLLVAPATA